MKETIILTTINSKELLKSFALYGKKSFNTKVFKPIELAKEALFRCGLFISEEEIDLNRQELIIYKLLKEENYFENCSFLDAKHFVSSINYSRMLSSKDEEEKLKEVFSKGNFKDKNSAILNIYLKYKKYLKDNNLIDSIGIINYAIEKSVHIDANYYVFKETKLEPLEEELLKVVSNNNYNSLYIKDYFGLKDKPLNGLTYLNGYGIVNEIEAILGYIIKEKIAYDDVVVVLLDKTYLNHFINYRDVYGVKMTLGVGEKLVSSKAYKILILLDRWNKGHNAIDSFDNLINSAEFNTQLFWDNIAINIDEKTKKELVKIVGELKLSIYQNNKLNNYKDTLINKNELDKYEYIRKILEELNKGYSYLIKTYTNSQNESFEKKAIEVITSYIDLYFDYLKDKDNENNLSQQLDDIILKLKDKYIQKELSKSGYLHITDIDGALACIRKHLFICGLNAKVFPGSPNEDYLLLDSDLVNFKINSIKDSNNKIQLNKDLLKNIISNASSFESKIHLSYSGYSLAEMKTENPSSILFEIYKTEKGENVKIEDFKNEISQQRHYFYEDISSLSKIGRKYLTGSITKDNKKIIEDNINAVLLNRVISPSSADIFFTCQYRFYLSKILGIDEPEKDDPFKTIPENEIGTLVHQCLEEYGNNPDWAKDEYLNCANKIFNDYLKRRVPLFDKDVDKIYQEYQRMVINGYENDPKEKEVVSSEKYIGPYKDPITGLTFGGIVDRIEKLDNGKYRVVDYKTYKDIKNYPADIDSCFQVVLYAYILENQCGLKIDDCEYRYLRNVKTISVEYNTIKNLLPNKLNKIKDSLDSGVFLKTTNEKEDCTYCKYKDICKIEREK